MYTCSCTSYDPCTHWSCGRHQRIALGLLLSCGSHVCLAGATQTSSLLWKLTWRRWSQGGNHMVPVDQMHPIPQAVRTHRRSAGSWDGQMIFLIHFLAKSSTKHFVGQSQQLKICYWLWTFGFWKIMRFYFLTKLMTFVDFSFEISHLNIWPSLAGSVPRRGPWILMTLMERSLGNSMGRGLSRPSACHVPGHATSMGCHPRKHLSLGQIVISSLARDRTLLNLPSTSPLCAFYFN